MNNLDTNPDWILLKEHLEWLLLKEHLERIKLDLNLKHEPVVFFGQDAKEYIENNDNFSYLKKKKIKSCNGYFDNSKKINSAYKKTGVVCIFKPRLGTLAHELRHCYQYQNNNKWVYQNWWKKILCDFIYPFYPAERDAFKYALYYLIRTKTKLAIDYEKEIKKHRIKVFFYLLIAFIFITPLILIFINNLS